MGLRFSLAEGFAEPVQGFGAVGFPSLYGVLSPLKGLSGRYGSGPGTG